MSSVPEQLGQYEILGPIGAGGMGEVYVARDPTLGRRVAIKVLPIRLSADRDNLTRFTQEARSASALNHPNIVTIHEVGSDAGTPYIVMEHIDGKDLRSYINEAPILSRKLLDIAAQIAEGLAAAHEQRIVHRDLKPENIMVTKDGYVKILDFGLAKIIRPAPTETDVTMELELPGTTPGTILGTVGYMSPEQATGRPLDFRSDQFALGAILYELATGKAAFDGETAIDTLSGILHDDPEPIQKTNPRAPAPFCWIVGRLLSKSPNDRYASTRDLAHELRAIRDRVATEGTGGIDMPFGPPDTSRRKPLLYVGLAVALAAGLAFVADRAGVFKPAQQPAAVSTSQNYLAVMRFKDLSGDQTGQLVLDGFAETLTARLAHYPSVQVMRPTTTELLNTADVHKIAHDLGANLVLTGSMQREGERIRVKYAVIDIPTGVERGDLVDGNTTDLFGIQDKVADGVALTLNLGTPLIKAAAMAPHVSQRRYLEAIGHLRRYDDPNSVDSAITILEELGARSSSASIQAALARAYLYKFQLTHDPTWAAPATAACERAVAADPQNPDVRVTLGELRRQTGRIPDAVAEFNQALAQQPNNSDAMLGLAETYKAAGKLQDAELAYQRSIQLNPQFWGGYNRLGVFYFLQSRYADSVKMFEKVTVLLPDNLRGYNNLGAAYQQLGRYEDAITMFSRTIKIQPTAQAYSNLGTCYYFLGRYPESSQAFQEATKLSPSWYLYWSNLGDAFRWSPRQAGQASSAYERAITLARKELVLNSSDSVVRACLAVCLAKTGHPRQASDEIAKAIANDSTNPNFLYKAAVIETIQGHDAAAIAALKGALARGYNRTEVERDPEFQTLRSRGLLTSVLK
jgi:tetratricopeptide (TPR) repeat protein/TolB-like protein